MESSSRMAPVVGLITYSFLPRTGGAARLAHQLASTLPELGWEVELVAPIVGPIPDLPGWPAGARIHWAHSRLATSYEGQASRAGLLRAMASEVRALRGRVAIWLSLDFQIGALAALAGAGGAPVVAHFGADPVFEMRHYKLERWGDPPGIFARAAAGAISAGLGVPYRRISTVVAPSEWASPFVARFTSAPVEVIPCSATIVDLEAVRARAPSPTLLVVSRFVPWKGIDTALEIGERLSRRIPGFRMKLVGNGPLASRIGRVQAPWLELQQDLPPARMEDEYAEAWAMAHPSRYETFGMALVEAMGAGLVVVGSDIRPISDLIVNGRTGWLLPEDDIPKWCDLLERILSSPDSFSELRSAAREEVRSRHSLERMAGLYDRCLRRVLRSPAQASSEHRGSATTQ